MLVRYAVGLICRPACSLGPLKCLFWPIFYPKKSFFWAKCRLLTDFGSRWWCPGALCSGICFVSCAVGCVLAVGWSFPWFWTAWGLLGLRLGARRRFYQLLSPGLALWWSRWWWWLVNWELVLRLRGWATVWHSFTSSDKPQGGARGRRWGRTFNFFIRNRWWLSVDARWLPRWWC